MLYFGLESRRTSLIILSVNVIICIMSELNNRRHESCLEPASQEALFSYYGVGSIEADDLTYSHTRGNVPYRFTETTQRAYPFTTENMTDYVGKLSLKDKDIAAVCGSNDFAINAFMQGAKSVDAIDVMQTACLYGELKTAGLTVFDRSEFNNFFVHPYDEDTKFFDHDMYQRLKPHLSAQTKSFFDQVVSPVSGQPTEIAGFFIDKVERIDLRTAMNPYLEDDASYNKASEGVHNVLFHPTDFTSFLESVHPTSYDIVYLSNIMAYMDNAAADELLSLATTRLKPGGKLLDFRFIYPEVETSTVESKQHQQAESLGLEPWSVIGTVPQMDHGAPGSSGFRSFLSVLEKAA